MQRIELTQQSLTTQAPLPTNSSTQNHKNKCKTSTTKISDISKSLQNQIELHDSNY